MHMLAAIDLGGTHCRFARFAATPRGLDLEAVETCPTAGLQDSDTVLQQWESCLHTPLSRVAALVMGVAGPVQDGLRARLSNAPLRIDLNAVMPQFGLRRARVVNDFVCEACACLTRVGERSLHLLG
ncbi:glucokinase, partial [Desulfovibrio sp.]